MQNNKITRRQAVAGLGVSLAAAALTPGTAIAETNKPFDGPAKLDDPRTKYPKSPYKYQPQTWPGLQSKMDPVPDCGETSYKGSGRLMGRKALITGGDSGMGRGAAIAYAREGADVVINYYPTEEEDAKEVIALIKAAGRQAVAIPGDLRSEPFCKKLVQDALAALGDLISLLTMPGVSRQHHLNSISLQKILIR